MSTSVIICAALLAWAALVVGTIAICAANTFYEHRERRRARRRGGYIR